MQRSCHRIKMPSASVSSFHLGDRRVWSMWHCLSFCSGPGRRAAIVLWEDVESADEWQRQKPGARIHVHGQTAGWYGVYLHHSGQSHQRHLCCRKTAISRAFVAGWKKRAQWVLIAGASSIPPKTSSLGNPATLVWCGRVLACKGTSDYVWSQIEWACFALIMTIVDVLDSHLSEHNTEVLLYWNVNVVVSIWFVYLNRFA